MTSVTRAGSSDGWRIRSCEITCAAMSSARTSLSCPPMLPTAVRTPSTMYASVVMNRLGRVLLLRAIHGGVHETHACAVLACDRHSIECEAFARALLLRHGDELVVQLHRRRIGDRVVHAHRDVPVRVRGERQRAVGEREDDAS